MVIRRQEELKANQCCIRFVVAFEFFRALEESIEHCVNLLQHGAVIVLDHSLVKILVTYFPLIPPFISISHGGEGEIPAHSGGI